MHCLQRRTELGSQVTYTENFVRFGHMIFEYTSGQTNRRQQVADRPTDTLMVILRNPTCGGLTNSFL